MSSSTTTQDAQKSGGVRKSELVEIKNGKVIFKQKPLSFEKQSETMQEMIQFRDFLEKRIVDTEEPLKSIPEAHLPLIAKLAHESEKSLNPLAKHLRTLLLPSRDDSEEATSGSTANMLPVPVIESAIKSILTRSNYGLEGYPDVKPPASACVWRWEVHKENLDWLPKSSREKAESRIKERVQAKQDLETLFQTLPQEVRDNMVDPKGISKQMNGPSNSAAPVEVLVIDDGEEKNQSSSAKGASVRPKKPEDPEKAAKEKEKEEKKAAKAEKERKEKERENKSRSLMANFFIKPKDKPTGGAGASLKHSSEKEIIPVKSDFETVFKPFVLRKGAELAPRNRFLYPEKLGSNRIENGVIILEDGEHPNKTTTSMEIDFASLSNRERLQSLFSTPSVTTFRTSLPRPRPPYKSYCPVSVRSTIAQLAEAEVSGDASLVRPFFRKLADQTLFPIKVLIFWDDARPGYYGTWTRSSTVIGPRTPLARDVVEFDYGYQSGEDWEEEANEEADDVVDDEGDEEDGSEADSDADSWLVGDDEEIEVSEVPDPEMLDFDGVPMPPPPLPKRKQESEEKAGPKKRKVVVPLVPFAKGPCYENEIGTCSYDAFESYRIQLFNDTPYPIDPFTFVSSPVLQVAKPPPTSTDQHLPVSARPSSSSMPSLNKHTSLPNPAPPVQNPNTRRTNTAPKTAFPDAHLPVLISKLTSLEAASITTIVDAVHQELKAHKIKKNAIEARIKEIGEKCKEKRVWVLKPGVVGS